MKIWIVWLPNVWKSTLFNALTKSYSADAANFPFCTIEPNVGIVDVKDERLDKLAEISKTQKIIHATTEFVDIAGLVKWANKWEWLGNKFLSHIREVDCIVQVLRHFPDSDVVHVEWWVDPLRDVEIINTELIFADLEHIDRILPQIQKKAKTAWNKDDKKIAEILEKIKNVLHEWKLANSIIDDIDANDLKLLKSYNFLTLKPFVYALNIWQDQIWEYNSILEEYKNLLKNDVCIVCAKLEEEMLDLEEEEKIEFIKELCELDDVNHVPTLDDLIHTAFEKLGLMYYFTTWEKETRAWTVKIWSTAPRAAAAIHNDFERWFIKAEVVNFKDFVEFGWWNGAKENGKLKLEWKTYIVQDWDIIVFKFNV